MLSYLENGIKKNGIISTKKCRIVYNLNPSNFHIHIPHNRKYSALNPKYQVATPFTYTFTHTTTLITHNLSVMHIYTYRKHSKQYSRSYYCLLIICVEFNTSTHITLFHERLVGCLFVCISDNKSFHIATIERMINAPCHCCLCMCIFMVVCVFKHVSPMIS